MKFTIHQKDKITKFVAIMKHMKQLVTDVNIGLCELGLYIQGMDASHVGLFELKLEKAWFDEWKGRDAFHYDIGINCEILSRIMSCYSPGQYVEFSYMENSTENLIIKFEGMGHDKMFEMRLIDIDVELMQIPDVEYDADITMSSKEFNNLMAEGELFGESINIELGSDDYIYINTCDAGGNPDGMRVRIKEDDIVEYALAEDTVIKHSYSLKYCLLYSKFAKINKNVCIHLKDGIPLKMVYDMSHWMDNSNKKQCVGEDEDDEEIKKKNYLGFYLAPKVDEE